MNSKNASEIIAKYKAGTCTEEEIALLQDWIMFGKFDELNHSEAEIKADLEEINSRLHLIERPYKTILWPRIAVAVAAVAAVVFGVYFFTYHNEVASIPRNDVAYSNDVAPGKYGATITLANGQVIALSGEKKGVVVGNGLTYSDGSEVGGGRHPEFFSSVDSFNRSSRRLAPFISGSRTSETTIQDNSKSALQGRGPDLRQDDDRFNKTQLLTASTAKGQTYQFTLPDGTKVWLNADSKISFPSQFNGNERKILIEGEAYFEVTKVTQLSPTGRDGRRPERVPFIVESEGQLIEVLGTHFNVSAYPDEMAVKTTLLEGSVAVRCIAINGRHAANTPRHPELVSGPRTRGANMSSKSALQGRGPDLRQDDDRFKQGESVVLKPGQQSILPSFGGGAEGRGGEIAVLNVDIEEAVAWKNSFFKFNNEQLESIMRRIARWYNVEVVYQDEALKKTEYGGTVSRFDNISSVLKKLEYTGQVHFRIAGRKVYVEK